MNCRFCKEELKDVFIDLINSPASNSFLTKEELNEPETFPIPVIQKFALRCRMTSKKSVHGRLYQTGYYPPIASGAEIPWL